MVTMHAALQQERRKRMNAEMVCLHMMSLHALTCMHTSMHVHAPIDWYEAQVCNMLQDQQARDVFRARFNNLFLL